MNRLLHTLLAMLALTALNGTTVAKQDIEDEDLSYIANFTPPRYGYDKAALKQCIDQGRASATAPQQLRALSDACRTKATPQKCRKVSPDLPPSLTAPTEATQSPQQVCASKCLAAKKGSAEARGCELN